MKTFIRNFFSIVRRFKLAMSLNVAGLAVAFAAFLIILVQVRYERNFDRCHPTAERVFRVDLNIPGTFGTIFPRAFVEAVIHSSPHIEAGSLLCPFVGEIYFVVERNGNKQGFKESVITCHADLPKVFDFPIVDGDINCLNDPDKVMIPLSMAQRMYGDVSAVGQPLRAEEPIWTKKEGPSLLTVGAVYKDFPGNTQLRNQIYTAIDPNYMLNNFRASNYICYVLLDDASHAKDVEDNFNRTFDFQAKMKWVENGEISLFPLTDIYFHGGGQEERLFRGGNWEATLLLFCIALLVIVIAAINFTNFSTALAPLRIRSINTQKVLGSSDTELRASLLAEASLISMAAWLLSLLVVWGVNNSKLLSFIAADLSLGANLSIVAISGCVALLTGWIAGIYPSRYVTSFPPALALKGSFGLSTSGRKLRIGLIGVQFVISILLIISSGFISLQSNYMQHYSLGFDKDQVAVVKLSGDLYRKHHETYANRLKDFPGIEDVAFAMEKVASQDGYNTNSAEYKGEEFQYFMILCSANFLDVMGIPVVEGRDFSKTDEQSDDVSYMFNQTLRDRYQMKAGDPFGAYSPGHLIGFTADVKLTSLRQGEDNVAFVVGNFGHSMSVSYIRLKAGTNMFAAVSHIRKTLAEIDPSYPFDIEFYDSIFNDLYHKEEVFRSMILSFSLLAIILSLVGVFGLVVFETQYRRKEIGIRKVMGSTTGDILIMFNKTYLKIVGVCFVVAAPVAWLGVNEWLQLFAYKVPIYWWVFALALLIVALVTLATVSFQSWRAANANPIDSIKTE